AACGELGTEPAAGPAQEGTRGELRPSDGLRDLGPAIALGGKDQRSAVGGRHRAEGRDEGLVLLAPDGRVLEGAGGFVVGEAAEDPVADLAMAVSADDQVVGDAT